MRLAPAHDRVPRSRRGVGVVLVRRSEQWASVMEKVLLVEDLFDRGVLDEGRRVSKQPGRCCATGCEVPKLPHEALYKTSLAPAPE
jgi:4-hydroxybutyryl-CoA dehydratase / vinylacetyl-CoA-Delta-isomerase